MNKGLVGMGVVGGVIALGLGGQAFASRAAAKEVDEVIESVSEFVDIDYQKVHASLLGRGTWIKDIVVSPVASSEQYRIDELVMYEYADEEDVPTYLNLAVHGMQLGSTALGENAETLKSLGYSEAPAVDVRVEYRYEAADQSVRLEKFELGAEDMGRLAVSLHLSNAAWDESTLQSLPFSLIPVQFNDAEIVYSDDSFVQRMFDTTAAGSGKSVKQVKQDWIAGLTADPAMTELFEPAQIKEIEKFIDNPDRFSISFSPEQPISFGNLIVVEGAEDSMFKRLNIRFKAN